MRRGIIASWRKLIVGYPTLTAGPNRPEHWNLILKWWILRHLKVTRVTFLMVVGGVTAKLGFRPVIFSAMSASPGLQRRAMEDREFTVLFVVRAPQSWQDWTDFLDSAWAQ